MEFLKKVRTGVGKSEKVSDFFSDPKEKKVIVSKGCVPTYINRDA